jgi:subtilisin family serine protease
MWHCMSCTVQLGLTACTVPCVVAHSAACVPWCTAECQPGIAGLLCCAVSIGPKASMFMHAANALDWCCMCAGDTENLYSWSNTGACVKLFAPGVDIYGACGGASRCATLNDSSYTWASGTR